MERSQESQGRKVVRKGKLYRVDMPGGEHFFSVKDGALAFEGRFAHAGGDLRNMPQGEPSEAQEELTRWLREAEKRNPAFAIY